MIARSAVVGAERRAESLLLRTLRLLFRTGIVSRRVSIVLSMVASSAGDAASAGSLWSMR